MPRVTQLVNDEAKVQTQALSLEATPTTVKQAIAKERICPQRARFACGKCQHAAPTFLLFWIIALPFPSTESFLLPPSVCEAHSRARVKQ